MKQWFIILLIIFFSVTGLHVVKAAIQEENHNPINWIDPETKCQYLVTPEGGISPRMVDNGVIYLHMGCKPLVDIKKPIK